jgi:hypothetical protein
MRILLAACNPSIKSTRYDVCPVVGLVHGMLPESREHGHLEFPVLQLVYNTAHERKVFREIISNVSEVKMVRQNRELVKIKQQVVHICYCDEIEPLLLCYCPS